MKNYFETSEQMSDTTGAKGNDVHLCKIYINQRVFRYKFA